MRCACEYMCFNCESSKSPNEGEKKARLCGCDGDGALGMNVTK